MAFPTPDPDAWRALHAARPKRWAPLLAAFADAWQLPVAPTARLPGGEDCVAFAHGVDRVIKILAPGTDPARELDLLGRVRLPVPTPRVLGHLEIGGWQGLLLVRLPGVTLEQAWPTMPEPDRLRVLRELGAVSPILAAVDPPRSTPRPDLVGRAMLRFGIETLASLADSLPRQESVFLHGDLTDDNTFGVEGPDGWHLSGVLDFAGSYVGPPLVELIAPAVFFVRGHPARLTALLEGAGVSPTADQLATAHLLHPYAALARDVPLLGGEGDSVAALRTAWARLVG